MDFNLLLDVSPNLHMERPFQVAIATDPVLKRILPRANRMPGLRSDSQAYAVTESDRSLLVEMLYRLWGYMYLRRVFCSTVLPQHIYTEWELNSANYLMMRVKDWCGLFGKQFDTEYDLSRYCPECGAGAVVKEKLLSHARAVKQNWLTTGFGKLSDNELVVTGDVIEKLVKAGVEGFRLLPIFPPKRKSSPRVPDVWHIQIDRECGAIPAENLVDPGERCPQYKRGAAHRPGFWLLSPLYLRKDQVEGDMFVTRDHFGQFMGTIMPGPIVVVSQKVYRILKNSGTSGVQFEPVMLLDKPDDGISCGYEFDSIESKVKALKLVV